MGLPNRCGFTLNIPANFILNIVLSQFLHTVMMQNFEVNIQQIQCLQNINFGNKFIKKIK
jgi:hypothetical protein